ncbi:MAG TPA: hypothetical protein VE222_07670, partial [Nitrospiraceae bacterium]|nr:hypothetical protein [Nitrospiraceae bacterium]
MKVTVAVWDSAPLIPVTVTVYVPALPLHESAEVWEAPKVMLVGDRLQISPLAGETDDVRVTVPMNPLKGATVIVDVPAAPAL